MADEENAGYLPVLTAEEKTYFDNGGTEKPEKVETPADDAHDEDTVVELVEEKINDTGEKTAPEEKKHTTVSHAALEEERNRRKELAKERDTLRDEKARMEERFRIFQESLAPQKQTEAPPPRTDEDIFGAVDHARAKIDGLEQQLAKQQQAERHEQGKRQLLQRYAADVEKFKADTPDMMDAYAHVMKARHAELEAIGIDNPAQREEIVQREELQVAWEAYQRGKNPADVVYKMAKARGYTKKEAAPSQPQAADKLAAIAASQEASKSLSAAGGSAGGQMTLEKLARMSQSEFNAYIEKNPKTANRLMGAG